MKYNYKYIRTRHGLTYLRKADDSQAQIINKLKTSQHRLKSSHKYKVILL